jgi:hypothetical protein
LFVLFVLVNVVLVVRHIVQVVVVGGRHDSSKKG